MSNIQPLCVTYLRSFIRKALTRGLSAQVDHQASSSSHEPNKQLKKTTNACRQRWQIHAASGGYGRKAIAQTAKLIALTSLLFTASSGAATAATIYNDIPAPIPPNVPSLGYQATQTAQFGDLIQFAGTNRALKTVTVVMSDWAQAKDYSPPSAAGPGVTACPVSSACTASGFSHPLTLNLYNVDNTVPATPAPGTLIATLTQTSAIPWRPAADPTCPGGTAWRASDNNCYSGFAFTVTFNFSAMGITLPNQVIYGLAYNTQTWGAAPVGLPGPYESLNFGLNSTAPPAVGTRPFPDSAYWNTSTAGNYSDGGTGGTGTFRRDTGWTPFSGAVSFDTIDPSAPTAMPTLSEWALVLLAMLLLGFGALRMQGRP